MDAKSARMLGEARKVKIPQGIIGASQHGAKNQNDVYDDEETANKVIEKLAAWAEGTMGHKFLKEVTEGRRKLC
ncbi:hypothetical protein BC937DRAFT_95045 [Endogone sp. FLAS-F59071]|nr:hypothetical protein BC937DRAFT_95045 [Endogone sp. FLAS-F59071]|eukprot:RUS20507.1 hypothetical protein BC937DRAFT_95045 [Endogone sp. FLAS-F59071]